MERKLALSACSQHTAGTRTQVHGLLLGLLLPHRATPMGSLKGGTWILSNAKECFVGSHTKPRLTASSKASQLDVEKQETTKL